MIPEQLHMPIIQQVSKVNLLASDRLTQQILWFLERGFNESPVPADSDVECMKAVADDRAQVHGIWLGEQMVGAFATFIENEKGPGDALHVWCLGGDYMDNWLPEFLDYLDEYARCVRCMSVKFGGRVGWQKVLKHYGYKMEAVVMRKAQCH
jgi:hypothetical protein